MAKRWCGKYAAHVGHDWTLSWQPYRCGGVDTVGLDDGPVITIEARRQLAQWEAEGDIGFGAGSQEAPVSKGANMTTEPGAEAQGEECFDTECERMHRKARSPDKTVRYFHARQPEPEKQSSDLLDFDVCPETTCPLYGKAVLADHPHLDTPAAARRRAEQETTAYVDDLMTLSKAISKLRDRGWAVTPPPGTYPPEPVPTGPGTIYTPEQALAVALFNAGLRSVLWRPGDEGAAGFGMPFTEAREALRLLRGMSWELVDRG